MSNQNNTIFSPQFSSDLSEILKELGVVSQTIQKDPAWHTDWDSFERSIKEYLEKLKKLAKNYGADQFNIEASIGWPPKININLTFKLSKEGRII